jgi:putative copper export protein
VLALGAIVHTLHVVSAGVWLGWLVFTTAVVSPALKTLRWGETERIGVRSAIGRRYARVGTVNLALLSVFAVLDGTLGEFGPIVYAEYALLGVLFVLVAAHGAYFGRRLKELAESERGAASAGEAESFAEKRRAVGRLSRWVSVLGLSVSSVVAILAAGM